MLVTSCQQFDESNPLVRAKARFTASTEGTSRTTLGENYSVLWSHRDTIAVFGEDGSRIDELGKYILVEGAGTKLGVFEGEQHGAYDNYYALYPSGMYNSTTYGEYVFDIYTSGSQIFAERNFVDGANPMVAYGTKEEGLYFRNIFGIVELKIKGEGTICDITIEDLGSSEMLLSGLFYVNPKTAEVQARSGRRYLMAHLETPIALSPDEARSIYAILPPGVYEKLHITTTDVNGLTTTRTATNPITVERSQIVPVTEFEHKIDNTPRVRVAYLENESNFFTSKIEISRSGTTEGALFIMLEEPYYQEMINSGLTDFDIVKQSEAVVATTDYKVHSFSTYDMMGQTLHMIALPYDAAGNYGEVYKTAFVTKSVPIDSNYNVDISGEPTITSSDIDVNFATTPAEAVLRVSFFTSEEFAKLPEWYADVVTATEEAWTTLSAQNGVVNVLCRGLTPNTEYKMVYRIMNGVSDGVYTDTYTAYSEYKVYTFTTGTYTKSDATVTLSIGDVKEWSATVNLKSTNASKYKLHLLTQEYNDIEHIIDIDGVEVLSSELSYTFTQLTENTDYYIHAVAYDANGIYGAQTVLKFTTTPIIAEPNAEYLKFLGAYTFSAQNGYYDNESRTVTISQDVEGKTFLVKGLLHPSAKSQFGITDDTLVAKFYDNMIHIGGTPIAGSNNLGYAYVYASPADVNNGMFYYYASISSAYNNGVLTFSMLSASTFNGLIFYVSNDVNFAGYIDLYSNLVLTKQQSDDGQLENPEQNPETGW